MQLTANFSLKEFERSALAEKHGLDNRVPDHLTGNVYRMAEWLQVLRARLQDHYGLERAITITSGYRSRELNKLAGGSPTSMHQHGLAADIQVEGLSSAVLALFIKRRMADVGYDQNIEEFGGWVHVSLAYQMKRGENLVAKKVRGKIIYEEAA